MFILYALLAILGLGFLVFIHELGHYIVARRVGMRVEAFAIGFGKPLIQWTGKDGVEWRICILPFGGYVKIAGMQKEGKKEPHEIKGGFFGSSPWSRIKVAFMGPFVNFIFAFLAFTTLWFLGGREKPFTEFTKRIGWVDQNSPLYAKGIRPGDEILCLNHRPFRGAKDLLLSSVMNQSSTEIRGQKIDYLDQEKSDFEYTLTPYQDPRHLEQNLQTLGIFSPASYLIYEQTGINIPGAPLEKSGIQPKDRLFWIDGELVFSLPQLKAILAEKSTFLTVERQGAIFHAKMPRVPIAELQLDQMDLDALTDLRYNAGLRGKALDHLSYLPYRIREGNVIEKQLHFLDQEEEKRAFVHCTRCPFFAPLLPGDRILAIDGAPVANLEQLFQEIQKKRSLVIVQRDASQSKEISWEKADEAFDQAFRPEDLQIITASIGTPELVTSSGNLHLLDPIVPRTIAGFPDSPQKEALLQRLEQKKADILQIESPEKQSRYLEMLKVEENQPYLGAYLRDRFVRYNPSPSALFQDVFVETGETLGSLFSGSLSPKWLSGPVGIIHVVQTSWGLGAKEALFWMGLISLNLAILNLLPIPVLDGGHILLSLVEMVTKKPLKAKTMEWLVVPFVVLFIGFFFFVTYHDLARIFSRFF
ncbi:MAG: RIP metalloprotease RseP [Chlamydiota bacterium]